MKIGAFSMSLAVKDLKASKSFYEKLGFSDFGGVPDENWVIMKNEDCVIGLFQGMFEGNILTFNPGWDENAQEVNPFTDIRELEKMYKEKGIEFISNTEGEEGPASFMIKDPDGNVILVDQHR
jgi:predicted lactoylglutathione lyase